MCKRMIDACVVCRGITPHLMMCGLYDSNRLPNAWLSDHAKKDKNNVKNTIKFTFCSSCTDKNDITTQPELDLHYKQSMESIKSTVRVSYVGVVEVRNRFNFGVIFLDQPMESIASRRLSLNRVIPRVTANPVVIVNTMVPRVELKRIDKKYGVIDTDEVEEFMNSISRELGPHAVVNPIELGVPAPTPDDVGDTSDDGDDDGTRDDDDGSDDNDDDNEQDDDNDNDDDDDDQSDSSDSASASAEEEVAPTSNEVGTKINTDNDANISIDTEPDSDTDTQSNKTADTGADADLTAETAIESEPEEDKEVCTNTNTDPMAAAAIVTKEVIVEKNEPDVVKKVVGGPIRGRGATRGTGRGGIRTPTRASALPSAPAAKTVVKPLTDAEKRIQARAQQRIRGRGRGQ